MDINFIKQLMHLINRLCKPSVGTKFMDATVMVLNVLKKVGVHLVQYYSCLLTRSKTTKQNVFIIEHRRLHVSRKRSLLSQVIELQELVVKRSPLQHYCTCTVTDLETETNYPWWKEVHLISKAANYTPYHTVFVPFFRWNWAWFS